jgi:lipoic acid synthetase
MQYKKKILVNQNIKDTYNSLKELQLNTICVEGNCPNIGECFSKGKMTFLILGDICTRHCLYCSVNKNKIGRELNYKEIDNIKQIVTKNKLSHIVVTSVTRDDLEDGGSGYYSFLCKELKQFKKDLTVEILVPDFGYKQSSINKAIDSKADILSHNIELTESVYKRYRPTGEYIKSLEILKEFAKSTKKSKSAFILGFGETIDDIKKTIKDIANSGVDYLSVGQYLAPSKTHMQPIKYYTNEEFNDISNWTKENFNFEKIDISFYSRSSYLDAN